MEFWWKCGGAGASSAQFKMAARLHCFSGDFLHVQAQVKLLSMVDPHLVPHPIVDYCTSGTNVYVNITCPVGATDIHKSIKCIRLNDIQCIDQTY